MGATSGQLDAANLLKPELAKGDLKVIGATTVQEYKNMLNLMWLLKEDFSRL